MKLRIQENVLRFRLTQKEVACVLDCGVVECAIRFPAGRELSYTLASLPNAAEIYVDYIGDTILVASPRGVVNEWSRSSQVSIEGPRDSGVEVLIEKDFQCLHRPAERDPDAYPNPIAIAKKRSAVSRPRNRSFSRIASAPEPADAEAEARSRSITSSEP